MKKTKTLHKVLSLCLVFALCAALALVLSACGKQQEAAVDYVREEGVSAEDYFAKVLKQNASAREKFTAAARGYNMSAEGFDDANLPEITADTAGVTAVVRGEGENAKTWLVNLDGAKAALASMTPTDDSTKAKYSAYCEELTAEMIPAVVEKMQTAVEITTKNGPIDTLLIWIGKFLQILTKLTGGYYVLALFIFAIIIEIIMLPFGIKQQKNSIKQAKMRPKEMAIRKKYAGRNDQATMQKMQAELQKMYQEEGFNPMGGCLPLLIQFPIIIALYNIVVDPLRYVLGLASSFSSALTTYCTTARAAGGLGMTLSNTRGTIELLSNFGGKAPEGLQNFLYFSNAGDCYHELTNITFPNFSLFGQNMGLVPGFHKPYVLLVVPVLTFVIYFLSMKINRKLTYQPVTVDQQTGCSNNMMDIGMPLMSVYISFIVPAAVGIYWIFKSIIGTLKQFLLQKFMPLPVFTEEEYKAAEKEMKGKKPPMRAGERTTGSGKVVRSLHHIDDDDDELPPPQPESGNEEEETPANDSGEKPENGMAAPLKEDRKDKKK